jgi:DNA polymerase III alpha subunit
MNVNKYGAVIVNQKELFDVIYSGKIKKIENIFLDDDCIEQFNSALRENRDSFPPLQNYTPPEESLEFFDEANQCTWFMPEEYNKFPIHQWLLGRCATEEERTRVDEELLLFIQYGMFDLLYYLKYLVDTMRANKIVWGVGRGSSVASYVLYLIGIHKINSIKYNLDIKEFLK